MKPTPMRIKRPRANRVMPTLPSKARTPMAPGLSITALVFVFACASPGVPTARVEAERTEPALEAEAFLPALQAEADSLLALAQTALDEGDYELAVELSRRVEGEFTGAAGSVNALWIRARAAQALGELEASLEAVRRFRSFLPDGDERIAEVVLLEGSALQELGRNGEAIAAWLSVSDEPPTQVTIARVQDLAEELTDLELVELLESEQGLVAPILAEFAFRQYRIGAEDGARVYATRAMDSGATGRARLLAEGVLAGDLSEFVVMPRIGTILPTSGSPRLREVANGIQEGVRLAVEMFGQAEGNRTATELVLEDSGGDVIGARIAFSALEASDVFGIIGPLQDGALSEVASRVQGSIAVISPTSPILPQGSSGVYSLSSADPGASRALARYAVSSDLNTAVVVYPESTDGLYEARAFSEEFQSLGGLILGEISYPTGSTFFEEQLRQAEELLPDVLVLPIPARDVELLAPQVTFFGLDSLEIRVLGTAAWSEKAVLSRVETRHTNGVVTASPLPVEGVWEGYRDFVEAYEAYYQRTLPDLMPALGYDAAGLLLEGIRGGASNPAELLEALEAMPGFSGATGRLFVDQGRVVRDHYVGCLQDRQMRSLADGARSDPILAPPLPDPETDSIPEGALDRVVGFRCPTSFSFGPAGR